MTTLARLLVRKGKAAGLYLPLAQGLPTGIWEIRDIMGVLTLVRVGSPAMGDQRFQSLEVAELVGDPFACRTQKEITSV